MVIHMIQDGPTWHYFAQNLCENLADDCEVQAMLRNLSALIALNLNPKP